MRCRRFRVCVGIQYVHEQVARLVVTDRALMPTPNLIQRDNSQNYKKLDIDTKYKAIKTIKSITLLCKLHHGFCVTAMRIVLHGRLLSISVVFRSTSAHGYAYIDGAIQC